jgi:hypothetical protein
MSKQELAKQEPTLGTGLFANTGVFGAAFEVAERLAKSTLIPKEYRDKPENVFIALEIANRKGISPLAVMQNLNVIDGRPSWSSAFIMTAVNLSGQYSHPLRFAFEHLGEKEVEYEYWTYGVGDKREKRTGKTKVQNTTCRAYTTERATGEVITGPTVSMEMAVKEGWYTKSGSKWKTMPEVMLRYRAAAFFARTNCPEVIEGLHTADEVEDAQNVIDASAVKLVEPAPLGAPASLPASDSDSGCRLEGGAPRDAPTLAKPRKQKKAEKTEVTEEIAASLRGDSSHDVAPGFDFGD